MNLVQREGGALPMKVYLGREKGSLQISQIKIVMVWFHLAYTCPLNPAGISMGRENWGLYLHINPPDPNCQPREEPHLTTGA